MITATKAATVLLLMATAASACAHELFVSFSTPTVAKSQAATAIVSNGAFDKSAGAVTWARLRDVSLRQDGATIKPDLASWKEVGKQSQLTLQPAGEGTILLGVSTLASISKLTAAEFGTYLELEDLPDMSATYDAKEFPNGVTYSYTKHARAIGQVGDLLTGTFAASLGYPLEIRLLRNPGSVKVGERLKFQVLNGETPVPDLRVYIGHRADKPAGGGHGSATLVRTDANGEAEFDVSAAKTWYIHTNHMVPSTQPGLDFVSDRASLTFEILPQHAHP